MPASTIPLFRIFLSSPGDVAAERRIAREILDDLNSDLFIKDYARIETLAWEAPGSRVLMPVSLTPQQAIDRGLAKPSETEAVIVILWGRMGTPLDAEKHGTKPDGTPYLSGTEWEYLDAVAGAKSHPRKLPLMLVYRRTDTPPYPEDDDPDVLIEFATQRKRVKEFFEPFRDAATGAYRANVYEYGSPDDFREQFSQDARLLVKELLALEAKAPDLPPEEPDRHRITWTGSPFPGLRAFTEKDEPIFFGRGYETADLIKRLSRQRLMFVVGASGSGKSSLVGAGVIPQLKRGALYGVAGWHVARFTPGDDPFGRLSLALLRTLPALKDPLADDEDRALTLAEVLRRGPDKLAQQVEKWLADEPVGTEVLLFIDQFEELFTTTPPADQDAFTRMLQVVSPQIRTIATMRSDFYDRALTCFEATLRDASYTLGTPSAIALYQMIVRPAGVVGLKFDDGLAEQVVTDTGDKPGNLALMAYALDELYKLSGDGRITHVDYDVLGRVQGAIGTRAEQTYAALPGDDDDKDAWMQRVFHQLVAVDERGTATRRRVPAEHIADADREAVIAFVDARLLTADSHDGVAVLEVAHEALFRSWGRLKDWIAEAQEDLILLRQLRTAAVEWEVSNRSCNFLWLGDRGQDAQAMLARLKPDLNEAERAFARPEAEHLLDEIADIDTLHPRCSEISTRLHQLKHTLPGAGLREDGLPDMVWLPVDGSDGMYEFEFGEFEVKPFFIARYLTTYVQFQTFLDYPDGFENLEWWHDMPKKYQKQHVNYPLQPYTNYPRDSVSWYQSVAFARWLDTQLHNAALLPDSSLQVRLPTEWEWQWAAMAGIQERVYPWGEPDGRRCNTSEAGISRTTAVGMYPHGAAECGALDVAGNLREWCQNEYGDSAIVDGYSNGNSKVLRGGAFSNLQLVAAASSRDDGSPYLGSYDYGLRLVVAAPV